MAKLKPAPKAIMIIIAVAAVGFLGNFALDKYKSSHPAQEPIAEVAAPVPQAPANPPDAEASQSYQAPSPVRTAPQQEEAPSPAPASNSGLNSLLDSGSRK